MKYDNNKYYTQTKTIEKMVDIIKNNLKIEDITEIIEPSAGDGRFYPYLKELCDNVYMYDIEPDNDLVEKQDFLKLDIEYKKGRIIVGNPPFGYKGNLYNQFIKKSLKIADYVAFILPSTQYNKNDRYFKKVNLFILNYY